MSAIDPKVIEAWTKLFLAVAVVFGFLGAVFVMLFRGTSNVTPEAMLTIGSLAAAFGLVVGYHYGSSSGSAAKQEAINKLAEPKPPG